MKNIKNIKYIILVVLVLVLIYILLKYKENFFESGNYEILPAQDFLDEYNEINKNTKKSTDKENNEEKYNYIVTTKRNNDDIIKAINNDMNDMKDVTKLKLSEIEILSKFNNIEKGLVAITDLRDELWTKSKQLHDSYKKKDKNKWPSSITKTTLHTLHNSIKPYHYDITRLSSATSVVNEFIKNKKKFEDDNKLKIQSQIEKIKTETKTSLEEKKKLLEDYPISDVLDIYNEIDKLIVEVNSIDTLETVNEFKKKAEKVKESANGIEAEAEKLAAEAEAENAKQTAEAEAKIETAENEKQTAVDNLEAERKRKNLLHGDKSYMIEDMPTDLNKIDRHLLWSNYTIEHDLEVPIASTKGINQYDMAYDNISEKGEVKYLKAGRSETGSTKTAKFLNHSDTYRPITLADNSIILIGSIVLTHSEGFEVKLETNNLPTITYSSIGTAENIIPEGEISDYIDVQKDGTNKTILIFKKNKYINIKDKGLENLNNFEIKLDFTNLFTSNNTITDAHMNYILINLNPIGENKPSEIIYDLINANYNILNYKTKILVNYLQCRYAVADGKWEPATDGKVCNLMDDGFIPTDLDSRLYGALKVTLLDGLGDSAATMGASITKNKQIIDAIIAYLGKTGDNNNKLEDVDIEKIKTLLSGLPDDVDAEQIKAALGYTG